MDATSAGLRTGQQMQNFELPDQEGRPFDLYRRLGREPLILVFYRGDWWPYCNGQLVSYAKIHEEFGRRGFGVAGISIDPPGRNAAMVEKLGLPFPLLSDPRGDLIKSLGLWNEKEGVAEPAILILDGSGTVRHLYSGGSDFSDRPTNEELLGVLDGMDPGGESGDGGPGNGGPVVRISAEEAENETVRPDKAAMTLDALRPYYRGTHFTAIALQKKLDGGAREKVAEYQRLVDEYGAALREAAERDT